MRGLLNTFRRPAFILTYHRIAEIEDDPWGLAVSPAHFREQLKTLKRFFAPAPLAQLYDRSRERQADGLVAITFDDGYDDTLRAAEILEEAAVPATFFVTSGAVDAEDEFWWDELRFILRGATVPKDFDFGFEVDLRREEEPRVDAIYEALWTILRDQNADQRSAYLTRLRSRLGVSMPRRRTYRPISAAGLSRIAAESRFDIGAHGETHSRLAALPAEEQRTEIWNSRRRLQGITGRTVTLFSYPFGQPGDYSDVTCRLLDEGGFAMSCCNTPGFVGENTDRFVLPRFPVPDVGGIQFVRQLVYWFRNERRS